jgi:HEAT repeat protein
MAGPTRYCPACYMRNEWTDNRCAACGTSLASDDSYDERLVWALDHPDTGTAMLAAEVLAERKWRDAINRLIELVDSPDPFRAAAAARALKAFSDDDRALAAVDRFRRHPSALVRRAIADSTDSIVDES